MLDTMLQILNIIPVWHALHPCAEREAGQGRAARNGPLAGPVMVAVGVQL